MKTIAIALKRIYSYFALVLLLLFSNYDLSAQLIKRNQRGFGTYDEAFQNRSFPYTFIIPDTCSPYSFIERLKFEIQTDFAKSFLLKFIFERYDELKDDEFDKSEVYEKALKAKLSAFIYMIGLKYNFNTFQVDTLPSFGDPGREIYAIVAKDILKNIHIPKLAKERYFYTINNQRRRSFELLNYLQAYDYLKTAKCVLQNSNVSNDVGIRELLMEFTFQLHAASNNWNQSYSRNNNLSLIAASAVGTAAVIFHAEGAGRFQYGRQPER